MDSREGRTSQGRLYLQRVLVDVGGRVVYQIALRKETDFGLCYLGPRTRMGLIGERRKLYDQRRGSAFLFFFDGPGDGNGF